MMRIKRIFVLLMVIGAMAFMIVACGEEQVGDTEGSEETQTEENKSAEEPGDINLRDIYGSGSTYNFTYKGKDYTAIYYYDNWCIYDSYEITKTRDMKKICQALIDEHPIHGSDYESYRTADDMVYEWKQHNLAHKVLPDDNPWKVTSGNVDFDPEDQGKSLEEIYEDRTGQEFSYSDHKDDIKEYVKRIFQ